MKRPFTKRIVSAALIILLIVPYGFMPNKGTMNVYGDTTTDLKNAKDKQADISAQSQDIQSQIAQLKQQTSDTQAYITQLDSKMSDINSSLASINSQISAKQTEITDAQNSLNQAQADAEEQYQSMKLRIRFMYEHNSEDYIEVLISSSDMGDLLNKAEYISQISEYDRNMLERYQETVDYIASTKAQMESDYDQLDGLKTSLEVQKTSLQVVQDAKNAELATLNAKTTKAEENQAQLASEMAAQKSAVDALVAKANEEAQKKPTDTNPSKNGGQGTQPSSSATFVWPTNSKRITSDYGDTDERSVAHNGIDIGASTPGVAGDPIYAAGAGTVVISTYSTTAGNWIWIYHGNINGKQVYTVYMHCSSRSVSVGDTVSRGQTIATMGTTGSSTGVHLHFGVWVGGTPLVSGAYVNPWNYLK